MALAANIVLLDALATPVSHTFIPIGKDQNNVFWFEDQSQANAIGFWKISIEVKKPLPGAPGAKSGTDRVIRVKLAIHEPSMETLGTADSGLPPPPTISYITRSSCEFILPERSSLQNRKDIRKMSANLINDAQVVSAVESLIPVF